VQVTDGMFDKSGTLANDETRTFLSQWMEKYVAWVQAHVGSR
jgi:chromate reductase, NAD(P)H dehydrogenase (quinone)